MCIVLEKLYEKRVLGSSKKQQYMYINCGKYGIGDRLLQRGAYDNINGILITINNLTTYYYYVLNYKEYSKL